MSEPETGRVFGPEGLSNSLREAVERLKLEAEERKKAARELAKFTRPALFRNPKKLAKALEKSRVEFPPERTGPLGVEGLFRELELYARNFHDLVRKELGRKLKQLCSKENLEFHVVSREDPVEVRIPPLSVLLDFKKSKALVQFARDPLVRCPLDAEKILGAWNSAKKALDRPFDPGAFFDLCLQAYRRVLRLEGLREGDRVELVRFLPELAFLLQPKSFRENPRRERYKPYGKAFFAYDILRLRRAEGLVRKGLRINFGVATGTTATKKNRVLYMEDGLGRGEYKLTIFFSGA